MSSTKYIGMEVHTESISIAVRNSVGKLVMECIIETKASIIVQFIDGLRGDLRAPLKEEPGRPGYAESHGTPSCTDNNPSPVRVSRTAIRCQQNMAISRHQMLDQKALSRCGIIWLCYETVAESLRHGLESLEIQFLQAIHLTLVYL